MAAPKDIAEQAMKGWRAVEELVEDSSPVQADQVGKDIDALKKTYRAGAGTPLSDNDPPPQGRSARATARGRESQAGHTTMVVMEPTNPPADTTPARKVVLVKDGKITGFQG